MRKVISQDKAHFYTYSKDFLSGSFPVVNELAEQQKEKAQSQARWLTPKGFDNLDKTKNWNEHPKKPDKAKLEDLKFSHAKQAAFTKAALAKKVYRPQDEGKNVFVAGSVNVPFTFSEQGYFKTVFTQTAEDVEKQQLAEKQAQKEKWQKNLVVANPHFFVNTRVKNSHQKDKMSGMLQDPVNKIGLRLSQKRLT